MDDVEMRDGSHAYSTASVDDVAGIEYIPPSLASSDDGEDVLDDIHKRRYTNDDASVEQVINRSGESLSHSLYLVSARDRLIPAISLSEETLQPLSKTPHASTASTIDKWKEHVVNFDVRKALASSPSTSKSPLLQSPPFSLPPLPSDVAKLPPRPISPERRAYPCDRCDRIFQNRSELRHHARRYEKRPYMCNECDASFLYPKDLRRHKTTHTGSKHYKCPLCHKSFSRKDNLRRHVNNEHGASDVALPDGVPVVARTGSGGGDDSDTEVPVKTARDKSDEVVTNGARGKDKVQSYIGMDNNRPQNTALASHRTNGYHDAAQATSRIYEPSTAANHASATGVQATGSSDQSAVNTAQNDSRSNVLFVRPKPRPRAIPNTTPTPPYHPPVRTGVTLICPFRRMKPLIHYCYSHPATIKNLVHHMKTTHNTFFHTYCLQIFPSQTALTAHDKQRVCCRSCKKNCGTREIKATHVCKPSELTLDQMWHHLYRIACGDGVWHNPFHGDDYDGAEQEARLRYPPAMPSASGAGAPAPSGAAPAAPPAPSPASSSRRRPAPLQHRPMPESNGSMPPDDESSDDGGGSMRPAPRTSPGGSDVSRYATGGEATAREYERSDQRRSGEGVHDAGDSPQDDDVDDSRDEETEDDDDLLEDRIRDLEEALEVMRINSENIERDRDNTKRDLANTRLDLAIKTRHCDRMKLDRHRIMTDRNRIREDLKREHTLSQQLKATGEENLALIRRLELENRSLREAAGAAATVAAAATSRTLDDDVVDMDDSGCIFNDGEEDDAETRSAKRKRTQQRPPPPPTGATLEPPSLIAASETVSSSARTRGLRRGVMPATAPLPTPLLPGTENKASSGPVEVVEEGVQGGSSPDWWLKFATVFDQDAGPSGMGYI